MKLSRKKYMQFSLCYTRTGRKSGYKVEIAYNSLCNEYYFLLSKNDGYVFNSLWKNMKYNTEEECTDGAEKYIDELKQMGE